MLNKIREFAEKEWVKLLDALSAQVPLGEVLSDLEGKIKDLLAPLEKKVDNLSPQDVFALLILRQLDAFIKVCKRDGTAPIISSLVYRIEEMLHDALIFGLTKKRSEASRLRDALDEALGIFEYEWHWDFYVHTLISLQKMYRIVKYQAPAIEGFAQWSKRATKLLEKGLSMRGRTLHFYLPPYYLYRGLLPTKITPAGAQQISSAIYDLWEIAKTKRIKLKTYAPVEGEEKGEFWLDFYEGLIRHLIEGLHKKFGLPIMDAPIVVRVAYDSEAQLTQSVAHFKVEGDNYVVSFFKPKGQPIIPAEEAHVVFHEVMPGHAYAAFLEDRFRAGATPLGEAWFTSTRLFPSFVDVFSVVHEGWALLAQEIGTELVGSEEVKKALNNEILLYVERVLVVEKTLPYYTVRPFVPRIADPYQFASYFCGYIVFRDLAEKNGLPSAIKAITDGVYPHAITEEDFLRGIKKLKEKIASL